MQIGIALFWIWVAGFPVLLIMDRDAASDLLPTYFLLPIIVCIGLYAITWVGTAAYEFIKAHWPF